MVGEFRDDLEDPLARFRLRKCESEGFQRFFAGGECLSNRALIPESRLVGCVEFMIFYSVWVRSQHSVCSVV